MIDHVCEKCGKPLNPVNWQTARVGDRYQGRAYKLCSTCAELADSTLRMMLDCDGHVKKDYPTTVEDVLMEFHERMYELGTTDQCVGVDRADAVDALLRERAELVTEYAKRLRLAGDAE